MFSARHARPKFGIGAEANMPARRDARCYLRSARLTNDFDKDSDVSGKGQE